MYSTIQKSALSQQINKTFFFPSRTRKASPFSLTSETRGCHGKRQYRAEANAMAGSSTWAGVAAGGAGRGGTGGGKGTATATRKTRRLMTDWDARQGDTEHRGTERWGWRNSWERVGVVSKHSSGRWNREGWGVEGRRGWREGGGRGNSKEQGYNSSKIERHFHMYILQMYIDTIRQQSQAGSHQYCNWSNRQERTILI